MPIATIPVTLNICVELPADFANAFALAPPHASDLSAWQYTAAYDSPAVDDSMVHGASLDGAAVLAGQEHGPRVISATVNRVPVALESTIANDGKNALIAQLRRTNEQLEDDLTLLYEELERANAALKVAAAALTNSNPTKPDSDGSAADDAKSAAPGDRDDESCADPQPQDADVDDDCVDECDDAHSQSDDQGEVGGDVTLDGVKLSFKQRLAAQLLASGKKVAQVARAVGVERNTVHTWKRENTGFRALLNTYGNDLLEANQARLLALSDCAVDVLATQVRHGNLKASLQLMKGIGLLTGKPRERACERADMLECNEM